MNPAVNLILMKITRRVKNTGVIQVRKTMDSNMNQNKMQLGIHLQIIPTIKEPPLTKN